MNSNKEKYDQLRKMIDEINLKYKEIMDFAAMNELYLNIGTFYNIDSGIETMSEEHVEDDWTTSNEECGYKTTEEY